MLNYHLIIFIFMLINKCLTNEWDYSAHGPDVWGETFSSCNGERQSPINIKTACTVYKSFDPFIFTPEHIEENHFLIQNNGHTITVESNNTKLAIQGGNLNGTFYFSNLHLHWGPNHNTGSEHQINGNKFSGESHFVYKNPLTDETVVLSFLMQTQIDEDIPLNSKHSFFNATDETKWMKYFDVAQRLRRENDSRRINLTLASLMGNNLNDYWRYFGSLTIPPCTENVIWNIFRSPVFILDYEFDSFRHDLFFESFRGPQTLFYRNIYRSFLNETLSTNPDQICCNQPLSNGISTLFNRNIYFIYLFLSKILIDSLK
ncbi:unnamed protein product [Adineta steineri]|uniref:carbonic anhydrase n=1 Tax=Adineta steineri TaxID=433720 RepID=A0A814J8R0_9BILA|nr:unnamed protein product [Adineta steineri]